MALELICGNRMEFLAEELADELRRTPEDPLAVETVIVHGPAMQRWLSLRLARTLGICANTRFEYPNAAISALLRRVLPGQPETSPFEPDVLAWRVLELLPACLSLPVFAPVAAYLRQATPRMSFQLAVRIAAAFDQYLIYRPEMIEAWQAGRLVTGARAEEAWQAELWRRLNSGIGKPHRLGLVRSLLDALASQPGLKSLLPARLSMFGISYLPRFHVEFFDRLSTHMPVRMYALNPCREYWGEIVSEARAARLSRTGLAEELYFEQGNPLLAAWGAHGCEFFNCAAGMNLPVRECFEEDLPHTMLGFLQSDILSLIDRRSPGCEPQACSGHDWSVQVHSCHSAMRELEVLHDRLLDLFCARPDLRPDDVLVLTPDMQLYAPCIRAVFGTADAGDIPFSIADRPLSGTAAMAGAFQALLRLPGSRMRVSDVLPLLECPAVQRRFGLSPEDVELLQDWIGETRICWALDENDRQAAGVPGTHENTWRFGIERMLLGYAMDENDGMFEGVLPFDGMSSDAALLAGQLADMLEELKSFRRAASAEHTLAGWSALLQELLQGFFEPADEDRYAWSQLQNCALRPGLLQEQAGFDRPVAFEVLLEFLGRELAGARHPAGFFSGSVTFAEMQPMRGIPFRIICLIGMNDRAFPRQVFPPGFNLIAHTRRPGDRERGKDDRYMFLEALLSARDAFIVTYTGQSQQDNAPLPPSVLVSELLDTLECSCRIDGRSPREHMFFKHHVQQFNAHYFTPGAREQSFSARYCACARALAEGPAQAQDFFDRPLPRLEGPLALGVDDLVRFFKNPPQCLLRERLNVGLDPQVLSIAERESFRLGSLENYTLEQELLAELMEQRGANSSYARSAARGMLPHGPAGRAAWEIALRAVGSFAADVRRAGLAGAQAEIRQVEVGLGECTLSAALRLQAGGRLVRMRHARLKPKDFLRIWLDYLVLCCASGSAVLPAVIAGLDPGAGEKTRIWHFSPVNDPHSVLARLLDLYYEGMCAPLVFMPKASFAYAEALHSGKTQRDARSAAARSLERGEHRDSELDDPHFGRFFDESIVEIPDFDRCARAVFGPILEHCRKHE